MTNGDSIRRISRGDRGRFVACPSVTSDRSLAKQKERQKAYLARASRLKKRLVISFVQAFIVKNQEDKHWLPECVKNSLLHELMEALLKRNYLEPRRSRHSIVKNMFHKGDPNKWNLRLPRKLIHNAELPTSKPETVPCFLGWRFPFSTDAVEMDDVKEWLRSHQMKLDLSFSDAMVVCYKMFNRYTIINDRFLYFGFPNLRTSLALASAGREIGVVANGTNQDQGDDDRRPGGASIELREHQQLSLEQTAPLKQDNRVLTLMASSDEVYRSLLLILHPKRNERFDLILGIWKTYCLRIRSMEKMCTFQEDLLEYCCFLLHGNTNCEKYHELNRKLNDQLVVFKMIRVALGLTLERAQTPWDDEEQA